MDRRDALKFSGLAAATSLMSALPSSARAEDAKVFQRVIEYLRSADEVADRAGYTDPLLRPAYHQHVLWIVAHAFMMVFGTRPEAPDWISWIIAQIPWAGPNPDDIYRYVPVDPKGTYRLSGVKGTAVSATLSLLRGNPNNATMFGRTLTQIDVKRGPEDTTGAYSIIVSPKRPDGYTGEWREMHPETGQFFYRSVVLDHTETDPTCFVERLDVDAWISSALPTKEEIDLKMEQAFTYAAKVNEFLIRYFPNTAKLGGDKTFVDMPQGETAGLFKQRYLFHIFDLADDEVIILESDVPKQFHYWCVTIYDMHFSSVDIVYHQTHLNNKQIKLDDDGKARIVVSRKDPGVPNWLDTGGWPKGAIAWRWKDTDTTPTPTIKKVKFSKLRRELPKNTPQVDLPQRREHMRKRALFYQTRLR